MIDIIPILEYNKGTNNLGGKEMSETIEIYKNYGVLGAEKRSVYTCGGEHVHAVCSDKLIVKIPEGWELWENQFGEKMVTAPWGWNYDVNEVLFGNKGPMFIVYDANMKERRFKLEVLEER